MHRLEMEGVRQRAQQIAREVVAPQASQNDEEGRFPQQAIRALADAGLLGLTVPEQYGGMGLGHRATAATVSALAEADPSVGMIYLMHLSGAAAIAAAPEDAQVAEVLHDIAKGRHLTTVAFSERGSRSHFWSPVSRVQNGGPVKISADKSYVTSANHADSYVVNTQSSEAIHPTESTLYLVDTDSEGVQVAGGFDGLGLRANDSAPVKLEDVEVPERHRLSPHGAGFQVLMNTVLPIFNLGSAAVSLGICRGALQIAQVHLRTAAFEHLGQTLGEVSSNLRGNLGKMRIQTDALTTFVRETAIVIEDPDQDMLLHMMGVKAFGAEAAKNVTSLGMKICGGAAFSRQNGMERYFRDAQAATVMAPTTEVLEDLIGRSLLDHPWF